MAKVVLVDAPAYFLTDPKTYFCLGLLYLASEVRKAGHEVKVMFAHEVTSWDAARKRMVVHPEKMPVCDYLGVSSTTPQIQWASEMAKAWPARCKILGGTHATYIMNGPYAEYKQPQYFPGFDYLMCGECNETLVQFIDKGPDGVPGAWCVERDAMVPMSGVRTPPLPDVTKMSLPAFDMLEGRFPNLVLRHDGNVKGRVTGFLMSSHGCPYSCFFCADRNTPVRDHTVEQVDAQFAMLASMGVTAIRFNDDTFNVKKKRSMAMVEIASKYDIKWRATVRANPVLCTKDLFKHYYDHGCKELQFGVEHVTEFMLKNMMKGTTSADNEYAIKQCQDSGMAAHAFLIVGYPGETMESIDAMREWVLRVKPDSVAVHMFQPLPGSLTWEHPEKFGVKLKKANLNFSNMWEFFLDDDDLELSVELPTISQRELLKAHRELAKLFRSIRRDGSGAPVQTIAEGESMKFMTPGATLQPEVAGAD